MCLVYGRCYDELQLVLSNISAELLSGNNAIYLSYQYNIYSKETDICYEHIYFVFFKCCYVYCWLIIRHLFFTLQDNIHIHTPYGIVSCAFVCLVTVLTTRAPKPSSPGGRSLFLAESSIFDIHTIALSNCVLCMVDVMTSHSWYRQNISAELLSGIHLFYISY